VIRSSQNPVDDAPWISSSEIKASKPWKGMLERYGNHQKAA
jgi:hypothetical protein